MDILIPGAVVTPAVTGQAVDGYVNVQWARGSRTLTVSAAHVDAGHVVIARAEPEYEPGGLYLDADGGVWRCQPGTPGDGWRLLDGWDARGAAGWLRADGPVLPLRKLVPQA